MEIVLTEQRIDAFLSINIVGSACIWAPIVFWLIGLKVTRREHLAVSFLTSLLLAFAAFVFCFGFMWAWALKDGLGPGMEVTHGDAAVAQFWSLLSCMLMVGAVLLVIACLPCLFANFVRSRRELPNKLPGKSGVSRPSTRLDIASFLTPPLASVLACAVGLGSQNFFFVEWIGGFVLVWCALIVFICTRSAARKSAAHAWLLGCTTAAIGLFFVSAIS